MIRRCRKKLREVCLRAVTVRRQLSIPFRPLSSPFWPRQQPSSLLRRIPRCNFPVAVCCRSSVCCWTCLQASGPVTPAIRSLERPPGTCGLLDGCAPGHHLQIHLSFGCVWCYWTCLRCTTMWSLLECPPDAGLLRIRLTYPILRLRSKKRLICPWTFTRAPATFWPLWPNVVGSSSCKPHVQPCLAGPCLYLLVPPVDPSRYECCCLPPGPRHGQALALCQQPPVCCFLCLTLPSSQRFSRCALE